MNNYLNLINSINYSLAAHRGMISCELSPWEWVIIL